MRRHQDDDDSLAALERFLETAPGVSKVFFLETHQKGGYRAGFELTPDCVDAFIASLDKFGWMTVI
jgi:hypothetical protein